MTTPWSPTNRYKRSLAVLNLTVVLSAALSSHGNALGGTQGPPSAMTNGLLLHYTFDQTSGTRVRDASGAGNDGTLEGGATWTSSGRTGGAVDLDGATGHVRLPNGLLARQRDMTVSTWVHADSLNTWARVFDFGTGDDNWMFLTLNDFTGVTRFATLPKGSSENLLTGPAFPGTGAWHHVAVVISGNTYTLYLNGQQASSVSNMQNSPSKLGATTQNYIGKSQFAPDPLFDGKIDDFRIYGRALQGSEVMNLVTAGMTDPQSVAYAQNWLQLGDTSQQTQNINLPRTGPGGTSITWSSSHPGIVGANGTVTRPARGKANQTVTLTATIRKGTAQATRTFDVVVWSVGAKAYTLDIQADRPLHAVSPTLYGVFFEDINYAADGGLYGELVQNRSFEFDTPLTAWTPVTPQGAGQVSIQTSKPLNDHNPQYVRLSATAPGLALANSGFDGIALEKGATYDLSLYARSATKLSRSLTAQLKGPRGEVYGTCQLPALTAQWKKLSCTLPSGVTSRDARLVITVPEKATVDLDMVSLFPQKTWMNRPNGMRYDLAKMLQDLRPGFFRFPGGCIVEGGSILNRYRWKNTIGDVARREMQPNQWAPGYFQSFGLGFHEYFQLSEDLGAEPLPIVFAGQTSCTGSPSMEAIEDLGPYIQDALDLIEYANGDATRTKWGALRAAHGHPKPFNLKYLGVGNELWGQNYLDRYDVFAKVLKAKHPEIKLVLSAGAFPSDANFQLAHDWMAKNPGKADLIDEHMYQSPQWFYDNVDRYDNYSRTAPKVFVGEYAAHGNGKRNNLESALAEAAFMTGLERNADVVEMASFAPLFAHEKHTQWTSDLIWFNNQQVYATPNYYVQQLFKQHLGQQVLPTKLTRTVQMPGRADAVSGSVLLGSWNTAVEYDDIKVTGDDGTVLHSATFADPASLSEWNPFKGDWRVENGTLKQTNAAATDARLLLKEGRDWTDYTLTLRARKTSGAEGFLIGFGVKNTADYYWWNVGGWGNTSTGVEKSVGGVKSGIGTASNKTVKTGQWYDVRIEVKGANIRLFLDDELIHDIAATRPATGPLYSVTTKDARTGDLIVKVVNISGHTQTTQVNVGGVSFISPKATVIELASASEKDENSFKTQAVKPVTKTFAGAGPNFSYDFPPYSLSVLRLHTTPGAVIAQLAPAQLTTTVGKPPQLPKNVTVRRNDGSTGQVAVRWKGIDREQLSTPGFFEVTGVVDGTYLEAVARVTVQKAR